MKPQTKRTLLLVASLVLLLFLTCKVKAAPPAGTNTVSIDFVADLDNSLLNGMSTNDYMTNYVFCFYTATNATTSPSNYVLSASLPYSYFTNQGPVGSTWTFPFVTDYQTRFYVERSTNYNGGVSPFSPVATWVDTIKGRILRIRNN